MGTNGQVNAVAAAGNHVYIGGSFTYVGPNTGYGVPLDPGDGSPVASFAKVNGSVQAAVSDNAGGYYIGGSFSRLGGLVRNNVAHLEADGSVDPLWNPNANGNVNALAVAGSTVYAGGNFTTIGGQSRNNLVALDASTGSAGGWNPNTGSGPVYALTIPSTSPSTLYAGGGFVTIGNSPQQGVRGVPAARGAGQHKPADRHGRGAGRPDAYLL